MALHHRRGVIVPVLLERPLDRRQVVPQSHQDKIGKRRRDAARVDRWLEKLPGRRRPQLGVSAEKHVLVQPVEMAFELEDIVPPRVCPGQTYRRHGCLGAGVRAAHELGAGVEFHEACRQLLRTECFRPMHDSQVQRMLDRSADARMVVIQDCGPEAGPVWKSR